MMVKTITYSGSASGPQEPIALDFLPTSRVTAAMFPVAASGADADAQVTLDNVFDPTAQDYVAPASARWFDVTPTQIDPVNGQFFANFAGPWRAVRLNVTATGTNALIWQVGQATTPYV